MLEPTEVQPVANLSPEESLEQTPQGADTPVVSSERTIPATDLDALRSIKDREIAAERRIRQQIESERDEWKQRYDLQVSRVGVSEAKNVELERAVNLRNVARRAAADIRIAWGDEIGAAAEEKLLKANDSEHFKALHYEFLMVDLPRMRKVEETAAMYSQRQDKSKSETVGITGVAVVPSASPERAMSQLETVDGYLARAQRELTWKNTPEGEAARRESRKALTALGYPTKYLPRKCSWAQIANALGTLRRLGKGGGESVRSVKV